VPDKYLKEQEESEQPAKEYGKPQVTATRFSTVFPPHGWGAQKKINENLMLMWKSEWQPGPTIG